MPALALAFAVRFLIEWTLALAAFWITRVMAVNQIYFVAMLFLSGQAAPLALLPAPVQALASCCPSAGWSPSRSSCCWAGSTPEQALPAWRCRRSGWRSAWR